MVQGPREGLKSKILTLSLCTVPLDMLSPEAHDCVCCFGASVLNAFSPVEPHNTRIAKKEAQSSQVRRPMVFLNVI